MGPLWRVHAACGAPLSSFCLFSTFLWLFYMHLNGNPVYTGYHNIWWASWMIVLTVCVVPVLRADTGKGVELCFHLWTCSSVSVGSFVSLPAGLDPGSHLNWDYWALNVSQITAAFHVWVHCAAPSARPSQQTLTSGLPVEVRGSVGKHLILIWVISCPPPHARVVPSQSHRDRNWDHHDWIWTLFIWTILNCVEVLEPGVKRGQSTELLADNLVSSDDVIKVLQQHKHSPETHIRAVSWGVA